MKRSKQSQIPARFRFFIWLLVAVWTGCIAGSLLWNLRQQVDHSLEMARHAAQITVENDVLYRRWCAQHGGVYVRVSEHTPPNPYLQGPSRDLTTTSGLSLTLVNPAYMTRQVNALARTVTGRRGHLTSLEPIRPENLPDAWEAAALRSFEQGVPEVSEVEQIADGEYLRLMRPFVTEPSCLECHAAQNAKVGDIRGGISVSIPLVSLRAISQSLGVRLAQAHVGLWLVGLAVIGMFRRSVGQEILARERARAGLQREVAEHQRTEAELRESRRAALNLMDDAVAARRQAEQALASLRQAQEDSDRAQQVGQIGSWRLDIHRNILTWSDENHRIFGVPKGTPLSYESFLGIVHPEDRQYVDTQWQACLRGEPYDIEHRLVVDGQVKWVREKAYLEFDEAGRLLGGFGIAEDITDRRRAEEALQQLNAKLEARVAERTAELARAAAYNRSVIEAAVDPLVTIGRDGKITDVNAATEAATGRTRKELVGTELSDCFTQPEKAREWYQRVFHDGFVRDFPLEIRHRQGGTTSVLYNASVYRDETGKVIGAFAAARDITERLRAEQALQAERQRLYDLLETLPVSVVLLSTDHHVPFANRFFRERFGESCGRRCFEYLFQRQEPCENCATYEVLSTRAPGRREWTGPDGRNYDVYDFPFVDTDGSTLILEMGIDITERKQAEHEARRMREELAHVDRVARLGELTASLAHELNQPLAAILSNAQAARRFLAAGSPDLDQLREILDDIIQDDKRAGSVIHRLRLMLQKGKQEPETFGINDAIREVVQLLHSEAVGRNAALVVDLATERPAVRAGRVEVQQVMVNLLLNALDAVTDVPADRREICVRTRLDQDAVVVAVQDRGCGLPAADRNSIFEPFFTTKPTGLGMGLAICRRMIQTHGGRIWAANNEDLGATVEFSFPFLSAHRESNDG